MALGPADVLQQGVRAVDRRDGPLEQQVGRLGRVDVQGTLDPVLEQAEVDTGVVRCGGLPAEDRRSQLVGIETVHRIVIVGQVVLAVEHGERGVGIDGLVAVLAPRQAELEVVERPAEARILDERFLGDVPAEGHRREDTVFAVLTEGGVAVATGRCREEVAGIVAVVGAEHLRDMGRRGAAGRSGEGVRLVRLPVGHHVVREARRVDVVVV